MNTLNWRKPSNTEPVNELGQVKPAQPVEKKGAKAISLCTFFNDAVD